MLVAGGTGARGAEIDPSLPGVTIQVRLHMGAWEVIVPDWSYEHLSPIRGFIMPTKWIPLTEFLAELEGISA